jgi:hypothetical protein
LHAVNFSELWSGVSQLGCTWRPVCSLFRILRSVHNQKAPVVDPAPFAGPQTQSAPNDRCYIIRSRFKSPRERSSLLLH